MKVNIDDLLDLDPTLRVMWYLEARERAGIVHRNVDYVALDDTRYYITTADLQRLVDEVVELRRDLIRAEIELDEMEVELDEAYEASKEQANG